MPFSRNWWHFQKVLTVRSVLVWFWAEGFGWNAHSQHWRLHSEHFLCCKFRLSPFWQHVSEPDELVQVTFSGSLQNVMILRKVLDIFISKRIYRCLFCNRHLKTQASFAERCHRSTLAVQSQNQTQDLGSASPPPASLTGNNSSFHMDAHSSSASAE